MFHSKTFYDPDNKIWYGRKLKPNIDENISSGEIILQRLQRNPDKIMQISANNGVEMSAKQMHLLSIRACQNLQLKGLKQNDVVGIAASNTHYVAPIVFGSLLCGTPISSLDPSFQKNEIKHSFGITKPKIIFCDSENYESVKDSAEDLNLNCPIYLMKGQLDGVETIDDFLKSTGNENKFVPPKLINGSEQVAAILCSSGTTGLPKGVCMSHGILLRQTGFTTMDESDIYLCFSSLYWLTGLLMLILGTMNGGCRIIIDQPFSIKTFFYMVEKYRITTVLLPPSQLGMLVQSDEIENHDLSSIKRMTCGGSAVPVILKEKMEKYLPNSFVAVAYGMSEIGGCSHIESKVNKRMGSAGHLTPNTEAKIIDSDGNSLGINETGEICLRIDVKWPGYYGNEKATNDIYDNENWVHSGDIGYMDDDGYLFIVDRKKDILKYLNFHFYPNEIEEIILQIPDIIEVSVIGLPDIVYTDLPTAVIVKKKDSNLTKDDVAEYVKQRLADFKSLRGGVYFVEDIPKTASGKVQRNKVKEMAIKLSKI